MLPCAPQAELFFHKFFNLSTVKSKRDKKAEEKRLKEEAAGDEADSDGLGSDVDDDDIDRLIEGHEKVRRGAD